MFRALNVITLFHFDFFRSVYIIGLIQFVETESFFKKGVDKRELMCYYSQAVARKQISTECKKVFKEI